MNNNSILILNGPGLGDLNLESIRACCSSRSKQPDTNIDLRQTDDAEVMFRWITKDSENFGALIINPAGYSGASSISYETYCSAIETIAHLKKPIIEVHISNIFHPGDETTRPLQVPEANIGFICGMGVQSYLLAISAIERRLT